MSKVTKSHKIMQPLLDALGKLSKAVSTLFAKILAVPVKKKSPAKPSTPKKVIKEIKNKKKSEAKSAPKPKMITKGKKQTASKTNK